MMNPRNMLVFLGIAFLALILPFKPAQACCTCMSVTEPNSYREWFATGYTVDDITNTYAFSMSAHETWIIDYMFRQNILPAMQLMAEQFTAQMVQQTEILGAFFDAKQQLETQRVFQRVQAEAHRDYHTSNGLCEFGTAVRSLASSGQRGEFNAVTLSQRSMDRQLGNQSAAARLGNDSDWVSRIGGLQAVYCDPKDNNGILGDPNLSEAGATLCQNPGPQERRNRDIDYTDVLDEPLTLKVNFTDGELKRDEQDVFALASNLYGHEVFARPPSNLLGTPDHGGALPKVIGSYMDARAILAKRAVAENSFNALVGMKTEGPPSTDNTADTKKYLREIIKELGVQNDDDIKKMLGENPSYYAQMEILTSRIYENPLFYTNLYDKRANVARKDVALKAISLMQKFDTFKSSLRTEANLSVLLEIALLQNEKDILNRFTDTVAEGQDSEGGGGP